MTKTIAKVISLIANCIITKPRMSYGDEPVPQVDRDAVDNEVAPDFSQLPGGETESAPASTPAPEPEPAPEPAPATTEGEPKADPATSLGDVDLAKIEAEQKQAIEAKPATEAVKADDKKADDKPAERDLDKELEELESMKPKPNAPQNVHRDFKALKEKAVKAIQETKALKAEFEKLKSTPAADDKTMAELKELREFRQMFELENDPNFQAEFSPQLEAANTSLSKLLVEHPKLLMDANEAAELMENMDTPEGQAEMQRIIKVVRGLDDPLLEDDVKAAFKERLRVAQVKVQKVEQLHGDRTKYLEQHNTQKAQEIESWKKAATAEIVKLATDQKWAMPQEIPADATAEQKKEITAHNKDVAERVVPEFHKRIGAMWTKDPVVSMDTVYRAMKCYDLEKNVAAKDEEIKTLTTRLSELEGDLGKIKKVSRQSGITGAAEGKVKDVEDFDADMSAHDAIEKFQRERGIK